MDMLTIREQLLMAYQQLLVLYKKLAANQPKQTNAQILVSAARSASGIELSKGTGVSPDVACAISVNIVHTNAFGLPIGGGASTHDMYEVLLISPLFREVDTPTLGCIAIDATGSGTNPAYPHGHVGIFDGTGFWANNSDNGLWSMKYTSVGSWIHQFETVEGYKTHYFLRI